MALGATQDEELANETLKFVETKARDQDVFYFFMGLAVNFKARRLLTKYFQENYDAVCGYSLNGMTFMC